MVGVLDYDKQREQRYSSNSGNAMCYFATGGRKFPESVFEGDGFGQGDVVEVNINRLTKTVKYSVNGVYKASHINEMLADNSRVFMPFVELWYTNDSVEWVL